MVFVVGLTVIKFLWVSHTARVVVSFFSLIKQQMQKNSNLSSVVESEDEVTPTKKPIVHLSKTTSNLDALVSEFKQELLNLKKINETARETSKSSLSQQNKKPPQRKPDEAKNDSQELTITEIMEQLRDLHFKVSQNELLITQNELLATADSKQRCLDTLQQATTQAEEKLAKGLRSMLEQSIILDNKVSSGMDLLKGTLNAAEQKVQIMDAKLQSLDELTELKQNRGSILHTIRDDMIAQMEKQFISQLKYDLSRTDEKVAKQRAATSQAVTKIEEFAFEMNLVKKAVSDIGSGVKNEFNNYVSTAQLDATLSKYTKQKDFNELEMKSRLFVKQDFVAENLSKIRDKIDTLKRHMTEKLAEKNELTRFEKNIKTWSTQTFAFAEKSEEQKKTDDQRMKLLEEKASQISTIDKMQVAMYQEFHGLLNQKADEREIQLEFTYFKKKFDQLANIEDYKALHDLVVPPMAVFREQMTEYSKDQVQFQEMIKKFEDNCRIYAHKHEILEYAAELRQFVKEKTFLDFKNGAQSKIDENNKLLVTVKKQLKEMLGVVQDEIKTGIQSAMILYKQKQIMKTQQNAESTAPTQTGTNPSDLSQLFFNKADVQDLQKIRNEKANKIDLQAQLQCMHVIHRMLTHLSVLLIETVKQGVRTTQSSVEHQKTQVYLLQQTQHVAQWIRQFNPLLVSVDSKMPFDSRPLENAISQVIETLPVYLDNEPIDTHIAPQRIAKKMSPKPNWMSTTIQDFCKTSSSRDNLELVSPRASRILNLSVNLSKSNVQNPGEMRDLLKQSVKAFQSSIYSDQMMPHRMSKLPGIKQSGQDSRGSVETKIN